MPWRVYRPAVVVGHSETGEMDKIDGPYYFFPLLKRMRDSLPGWMPLVGIDLGDTNVVPVDYVAWAMDHLAHQPGLDGQAFHLVNPEPMSTVGLINTFAAAAKRPAVRGAGRPDGHRPGRPPCSPARCSPRRCSRRRAAARRRCTLALDQTIGRLGIPPEVLEHVSFPTVYASRETEKALAGSGISVPDLDSYASMLWSWWEEKLDDSISADAPVVRGAGQQDRRDHRRLVGHRAGHRGPGRQGRRRADPGRARAGEARGDRAADREPGRDGVRLSVRPLRPARDRRAHQAAARGLRPPRLRRQQRRPLDPPVAEAQRGPVPRLRAHHAAELLRRDPARDGDPADDARAGLGPRREHLLDRRAHQPAAVLGVRRLQGRARRLEQRGRPASWSATASPSPPSTCRWSARR